MECRRFDPAHKRRTGEPIRAPAWLLAALALLALLVGQLATELGQVLSNRKPSGPVIRIASTNESVSR